MSNYSLRPEDFRFAWANAYQTAILDVRDLQRQSDKQLWWESRVTEHGFKYVIVRNEANFKAILKALID